MPDPGGYVQLMATDITKVFGRRRSQRHTAVDGVSLTVESGQAVGIVGESGSGKSTFARILAGIELPTAGTVYFNDVPIGSQLSGRDERLNLRRHVQMAAQDTSSSVRSAQDAAGLRPTPAMRLLGLSLGAGGRDRPGDGRPGARPRWPIATAARLRRPATAVRARAGPDRAARPAHLRRGRLRARRVRAGLGAQHAAALLRRVRGRAGLRLARAARHGLHLRPHRGHAARPDRRERPDRRGAGPGLPTNTPISCSPRTVAVRPSRPRQYEGAGVRTLRDAS